MKQLPKQQDWNELFQNEKLEKKQMNYLRGGDGPAGGDQDLGDNDPPIIP
jgi:hypothetical protein